MISKFEFMRGKLKHRKKGIQKIVHSTDAFVNLATAKVNAIDQIN